MSEAGRWGLSTGLWKLAMNEGEETFRVDQAVAVGGAKTAGKK